MSKTNTNSAFVHNFVHGDYYEVTTTAADFQVDGESIFKLDLQGKLEVPAVIVTATTDGLTTGVVPDGSGFVNVNTDDTADTIALPLSSVGHQIRGRIGPDTDAYDTLIASLDFFFKLDDGATTTAANAGDSGTTGTYVTGGNASATTSSGLPFWSTGSAQALDGSDDYISTPYVSGADTTGSFGCWLKRDSGAVSQSAMGAYDSSGTKRFFVGINGDGCIGAGMGSDSWGADLDTGVYAVPDRAYHVAVTWETGGDVRLYVDGILKVTHAFAGTLPTSTAFYLGCRNDEGSGAASFFSGEIDECFIDDTVLTQANISTLAAGGDGQACEICTVIGSGETINGVAADSVGTGVSVAAWSGWEANCYSPGAWTLTETTTTGRINGYVYSPDYIVIQENTAAEYAAISPSYLTTTMYVIVG